MTTTPTLSNPSLSPVNTSSEAIEKLNVFAYLTPDPYCEDGDFESEWVEHLPGFKKDCEDNPLYDDHNMQLLKNLTNEVENEFKKGVEYLWPLMQHLDIKYLQICVDLLGIMLNDTSAASYFNGRSDAAAGKYVFFASCGLAHKYMKNLQDGVPTLSQYANNIWRHELIHLLDDSNIQKINWLRYSDSIEKVIKRYLLSYRTEGVADLIYLLSGHNEFKSLEGAKIAFANELNAIQPSIANYLANPSKNLKDAFNYSAAFYDIGPWLIIDFLLQSGNDEKEALTKNCLSQLLANEPVERLAILKMVKYALEISNKDFLKFLKVQKVTPDSIVNPVSVNSN